ncbi:MAG: UDP-N-acetylmuramoyl-tripeptide--D-alanyl-D-alanine ligase [Verrucomicrobia bacterium]|nr:UDP-N-acetylmuramoyl-tripeptide--D-alanyl-D-alanine ligase [Verrucomicrobiota bacterium]
MSDQGDNNSSAREGRPEIRFRRLGETAAACKAAFCGPADRPVRAVGTDSRRLAPGDLFVALPGPRYDGHDFVRAALEAGAAAAVVQRDRMKALGDLPQGRLLVVEDSYRALADLASEIRRRFRGPVVAVAGSNGKTSFKEMLAAVLRQRGPVLASPGNYNNRIGVPLTLLGLTSEHWAAVVEAGTNHPGELAFLLRIIRPDYGAITSIGPEHLEFFKGIEGVIEEEGALARALPSEGRLFVCGDCEGLDRLLAWARCPVERAGFGPANEWRVAKAVSTSQGVRFHLEAPAPAFSGEYKLKFLGRAQAVNAAMAVAAGRALGVEARAIRRALASCPPPPGRLVCRERGGLLLLDDTYNANPASMLNALETLAEAGAGRRKVAILGDMAELGSCAPAEHARIGRAAARAGVSALFAVGEMAAVMAQAAREAGAKAFEFDQVEDLVEGAVRLLRPGDAVLVKASRSVGLERIVRRLEEAFGQEGDHAGRRLKNGGTRLWCTI